MPESIFSTTFLPFQELETVPHLSKKTFLQPPQANQELETVPPKRSEGSFLHAFGGTVPDA